MPSLVPTPAVLGSAKRHLPLSSTPLLLPRHSPYPRASSCRRLFCRCAALRSPYKDDQDRRDTVKPRSHDSSQGPSDGEIASRVKTSFEPRETDPKAQADSAAAQASEDGKAENPLELTGANRELSRSPDGGSSGGSKETGAAGKQKSSLKSSKKSGKVV